MSVSLSTPDPTDVERRTRVVLWRHGQTAWNVEGRFQGQTDIPLDPLGEKQARRAAPMLA